jgi:hypothetical protein
MVIQKLVERRFFVGAASSRDKSHGRGYYYRSIPE